MNIFKLMIEDVKTVFLKDPAARSWIEILTCYPGLHAIWGHRIAHALYNRKWYFAARLISHWNRFWTHIEIHPGARIGRKFFIDHGAGVVIGETTKIGNNVLIYQGVVLGGTSCEKIKRHPTIEDDVVIGAGAVCLGPITLGSGAKAGAGSVVINNVEADQTVVGIPAKAAGSHEHLLVDLNHANLPDPVLDMLNNLIKDNKKIKKEIESLKKAAGI